MSAIETLTRVIRETMPACRDPDGWAPPLHEAMTRFEINSSKDRVAVFLAQTAVESQEMNRLDENLNYRAERLVEMWPKRFPTLAFAAQYAGNPHKLADFVYANRFGNGPPESGDGWSYRGRGLKMVTFLSNYRAVGELIGVDLVRNPDHLMTKTGAAMSGAAFWFRNGLSALADDLPTDDDEADFRTVTRVVTGAQTLLEKRHGYWMRAKAALGILA